MAKKDKSRPKSRCNPMGSLDAAVTVNSFRAVP